MKKEGLNSTITLTITKTITICVILSFKFPADLADLADFLEQKQRKPLLMASVLTDFCSNSSKTAIISKLLCPFS